MYVQPEAVQVAEPWAGIVCEVIAVGVAPRLSFAVTPIVTGVFWGVVAVSSTASGIGMTLTGSLELLLAVFGSAVTAVTLAVFVVLGAAAGPTETESVIVVDAPDASPAGSEQVTVEPAAPQVHPAPVPER